MLKLAANSESLKRTRCRVLLEEIPSFLGLLRDLPGHLEQGSVGRQPELSIARRRNLPATSLGTPLPVGEHEQPRG